MLTRITLHSSFFACILLFATSLYSQSQSKKVVPYYRTESKTVQGINIIDAGEFDNAKFCTIQPPFSSKVKLSPDSILCYQTPTDKLYYSREISVGNQTKKVFLQLLIEGKIRLFIYRAPKVEWFFIEDDSGHLVKLEKRKEDVKKYYRHQLALATVDSEVSLKQTSKSVYYGKSSLEGFVEAYNLQDIRKYKKTEFGVSIGFVNSNLIETKGILFADTTDLEMNSDSYTSVGFYINKNISRSDIVFHPEVFFSYNTFTTTYPNNDVNVNINVFSINIPIELRYVFPFKHVKPYIGAGGQLTYHFGDIEIETNQFGMGYSAIEPLQFGYTYGFGVSFYYKRYALQIGYRTTFLTSKEQKRIFDKKDNGIIVGLSF